MMKYRFARVRCACGRTVNIPRYSASKAVKCDCGIKLYTRKEANGDETPVMICEKDPGKLPVIVGWQ